MRVLIVDDSPTIRSLLRTSLADDPEITVIGEAGDARQARDMIDQGSPDVVTLDIEMPGLDGGQFLEKIMLYRPLPVIVISDRIAKDGSLRKKLSQLGAFSSHSKSELFAQHASQNHLAALIHSAATQFVHKKSRNERGGRYCPGNYIVAIGASTGGVEAIATILAEFPKNCPATVVTQHMPSSFCTGFASRLDRACAPTVRLAENKAEIKPGTVLIAPGGANHLSVARQERLVARLWSGPKTSGHRPSVDELFSSCAALGRKAVGVILTGMGRDGADGLLKMRESGALTIGQDQASSVVYGMPRAAKECGAVTKELQLCDIANELLRHCRSKKKEAVN